MRAGSQRSLNLRLEDVATGCEGTGAQFAGRSRHVVQISSKALRLADGRYRSVASLYLKGKPLGPWRYDGLRRGDRNDVIPLEDRRELRASRLLAK